MYIKTTYESPLFLVNIEYMYSKSSLQVYIAILNYKQCTTVVLYERNPIIYPQLFILTNQIPSMFELNLSEQHKIYKSTKSLKVKRGVECMKVYPTSRSSSPLYSSSASQNINNEPACKENNHVENENWRGKRGIHSLNPHD
jgi:hypothetical protein